MALSDWPIKQKLTAMLVLISGLVLLLTSVAFAGYQYWYPANATDVSSRTSPLINTSIAVSFCLIGQSESAISTRSRSDDLGHAQQLGADRQVCRFRRLRVALAPDAASRVHEPYHASSFGF